jgi:hypothetical protein
MSCCNQDSPTPTQAKECDAIPSLYDCADDGTFAYNVAKRLRWFSSQSYTASCPDNNAGDSVTSQASVTSSISQSDADAQAVLRAQGFAEASLFCQPLFWESTQSYLSVCPEREDIFYAATVTAISWLSQEHADAKAYGQAYETVQRMINCCEGGPFEYTATYTASCTTGPSSPAASATAEVTASSCISTLNARQIATAEAIRAAELALNCNYPEASVTGYFTGMERCDESEPIPSNSIDPCNRVSVESIQLPPPITDPKGLCPVCLLYIRQCGKVVGIINVGCTQTSYGVGTCNYPPGTQVIKTNCSEIQIDSQTIVQKCNEICVLDIAPNDPPGCEPCVNGYGMEEFVYICDVGTPCGSGTWPTDPTPFAKCLGPQIYSCFGFCSCYTTCCIGDLFCTEY